MYSINWRIVKYIPSIIVIINLFFLSFKFLLIIEWWDHVIVRPEEIKMIVFIRGISNGLKGLIPNGGQCWPISNLGDKDEWKYDQKKEKKKRISEIINKIIPIRILLYTLGVWHPWKVDSRVTSRHHWYMHIRVQGIDNIIK